MTEAFRGRVAIVTGAGKGLGRAYAEDLAARGVRVVVNNRVRPESPAGSSSADEVVAAIRERGGEAIANYDSVEDPSCGQRLVAQALRAWGRLDVLVNNAGVGQHRTLHKLSVDQFREIFDINFYGAFYPTHAAYAHMREHGHGRIVVSTSSAGLHGLHGLSAYSASKAALIGFMRALASEGASHDVLTNAIAPYAATPMTSHASSEEFRRKMLPELVAPMIAYLVSANSRTNGQVIVGGKGAFRRAVMVEGSGKGYTNRADLSPETLERDIEQILSMADSAEYSDGARSFDAFFAAHRGVI